MKNPNLCISALPLSDKKTNPGEENARENQIRELQNISEEKNHISRKFSKKISHFSKILKNIIFLTKISYFS